MITVTNNKCISAEQVCEHLQEIAAWPFKTISAVLDNARYQGCQLVQEKADKLGINLVFLPTDIPNLNLIERILKLVKGELRARYYNNFDAFRNRVDVIIDGLSTTYAQRVTALIGGPCILDA